jgi:hypothetical protein
MHGQLVAIGMIMSDIISMRCDGCGQMASPEHIDRRLRRLEWATRYRPVHIQTLLLGAVAPVEDCEFLYSPGEELRGEVALLLRAVGIPAAGKPAGAIQAEFQRAGYFLTYILECPLDEALNPGADLAKLVTERLPVVASRIRRSLKPRYVTLVTELPESVVEDILALDLGRPVILDHGKPFALGSASKDGAISRFLERLPGSEQG